MILVSRLLMITALTLSGDGGGGGGGGSGGSLLGLLWLARFTQLALLG